MKRLATNPDKDDLPIMAATFDTLMPRMWLRCKQPTGGYPAGFLRKIYGGNISEGSVYAEGQHNPDLRMYMTFGGNEVLFEPLKRPIEEIVMQDNTDLYELVVPDPKIIQLVPPVSEPCRVIVHPATFFTPVRIEKPASKRKPAEKNPNQYRLPLYEDDVKPQNKTA